MAKIWLSRTSNVNDIITLVFSIDTFSCYKICVATKCVIIYMHVGLHATVSFILFLTCSLMVTLICR